ncbi:hypothetical protein BBI11_09790 [Planococcus maritimus]|uniref:DUF2513 domain-containing protein n=1 Tax=Planococcus maritimus TaxID=192421 RepID=UPI00080F25DA|nr:DUF2513 domain-containing protein [Planococcus maritimus]ANU17294.1 hypothetical protein BBI11_09790 [Planococcus maritimus]
MKRDMDLVRELLLLIEAQEDDSQELKLPPSIDEKVAKYHLKLLEQAGYIKVSRFAVGDNMTWLFSSLTWDGQEFLAAIKNDTVWNRVKQSVKEKGGSIPFEVLKSLAIKMSATYFLG